MVSLFIFGWFQLSLSSSTSVDFIQVFVYHQIRLKINSKQIWTEGMRSWRKEDWLCRRQREESRSGVPTRKERNGRERRGRLGKLRKEGRKRRRGGWRDRESWRGKGKKNVRKKLREKRWVWTTCSTCARKNFSQYLVGICFFTFFVLHGLVSGCPAGAWAPKEGGVGETATRRATEEEATGAGWHHQAKS